MTTFWILIAVLIAMKNRTAADSDIHAPAPLPARMTALTATTAVFVLLMIFAFAPAIKASSIIQQAIRGKNNPHDLLGKAILADKLSPLACDMAAKFYQQEYSQHLPLG